MNTDPHELNLYKVRRSAEEFPVVVEHAARQPLTREAGRKLHPDGIGARAGAEGTISQGIRSFGLRQSRYWGLAKTHLQHLATLPRKGHQSGPAGAWFVERPLAQTRLSRFAKLAPPAA